MLASLKIEEMDSLMSAQSYREQFANFDRDRYGEFQDGRHTQANSMTQTSLSRGKQEWFCDNRISKALAKLRSELLDLKKQDTSLFTQLRSIDSHIQRLKSEIRVEEEWKLQYSDDDLDEEDEEDEEIAYQLEGKKNGYYEEVLRKTLAYSDYDQIGDTAHERYDSGIQADEGDYEECNRSRTSSNGSWNNAPLSYVPYRDKGKEMAGFDSKQTSAPEKYTTFVLTTPTKQVTSSEPLHHERVSDEVYLRQPAVPTQKTLPTQKTVHRQTDVGLIGTERHYSRAQSDEQLFNRSVNHTSEHRTISSYAAKTSNNERTVPWQHEVSGRYFARKQGAGKTMSLVNISESGELMFHDKHKGSRTTSLSRKMEVEREVSRALDSFNRQTRPSSARASSKSSSSVDLRTMSGHRDFCLARSNQGTSSLSDLRPDHQKNAMERTSCGFALVPGQRNTLPVSRTSISDTEKKGRVQIKTEVTDLSCDGKHDLQLLKRTYSLSAKRPASMTNLSDGIKFYRSPSGENFQEHTVAYYNAARNFPRTVSVASLV